MRRFFTRTLAQIKRWAGPWSKDERRSSTGIKLLSMLAVALFAHTAMAQPQTNVEVTNGPDQTTVSGLSRITATVVGIDKATRTVVLKTAEGKVVELEVTNEARNFDQLQIGDQVTAAYSESLTLSLMKQKGQTSRSERETEQRADAGGKPGGTVGREVTIVADVIAHPQRS